MPTQYKELPRPTGIPGAYDLKQRGPNPDSPTTSPLTEQDHFYPAFWEHVIETSSNVPQGEDPAWWPVRVLYELDDLVTHRNMSVLPPIKAEMAAKLAPIHDSIRKIKTAFSIVAYPHSKHDAASLASVKATPSGCSRRNVGISLDLGSLRPPANS